ncbi:MAG: 4-phosphoerythronate dehydrogenase PdxB [Bacteroidaceae bacterium]|nr:4-phosphoerythronate dehydrogenase PdxB [Bacteroidaceae bacterium]
MKVIVDDKIPYIKDFISQLADQVVFLPGASITSTDVEDADALIIRTRTQCNSTLLANSRVRFIATATIGFDHIDTEYCQQNHITWVNCPGCNAKSVAQYVHSALLALQEEKGIEYKNQCMGIVGVGHVGSLICETARSLGMKILRCDPPRAALGETGFVSLEEIAHKCQIISFHTPLIKEEPYCTYHMADQTFFQSLVHKPIIINTSRGEVIETQALLTALKKRLISEAIIDVWEHEPLIDLNLLEQTFIGTPHIAGYSADGKANATRMVLEAFCHFFNIPFNKFEIKLPSIDINQTEYRPNELKLALYDPRNDSKNLKICPMQFESLRSNYPLRREKIG